MRISTLLISFILLASYNVDAQNPIRINEPMQSFYIGISKVSNDTFKLKYLSSNQTFQSISGSETYKEISINKSQQLLSLNPILIKQRFPTFFGNTFVWNNVNYEYGCEFNANLADSSTIWIKKETHPHDSMYKLPLYDSSFSRVFVKSHLILSNHLYLFGDVRYSGQSFSYPTAFKIDLHTKSFQLRKYNATGVFRFLGDAIYDAANQNFIVTSSTQIENPNRPFGAGICKLDTNLNLITGSNQTLQSTYSTHLITTPNPYEFVAGIEPVDQTSFLCVGPAINPLLLWSQTTNPNRNYLEDLVAGQRFNSTLQEVNVSYAHGKIDTAESATLNYMPFKRIDSNMFYVGMTSRFYNPQPEPWDTELALFGLNEQGQKHWEYYHPLNDYCSINDIIPDQNGGLWFVAQCSENLNLSTGHYESFIKVGYVDSVAFWPRIGAVGIEAPQKKQEEIVVYPNPTADLLKIKQYGFLQTLYYKLYDLEGRLVKENRVQSHIHELNLGELKPALYLLRVEDEKGGLVKEEKVMKR